MNHQTAVSNAITFLVGSVIAVVFIGQYQPFIAFMLGALLLPTAGSQLWQGHREGKRVEQLHKHVGSRHI